MEVVQLLQEGKENAQPSTHVPDVGSAGLDKLEQLSGNLLGEVPSHMGVKPKNQLEGLQQGFSRGLLVGQKASTDPQQPQRGLKTQTCLASPAGVRTAAWVSTP